MSEPIEMTIFATVEHVSGPVLNPDHARMWVAADGGWFDGESPNSFNYEVCSVHADPEHCGGTCDSPTSTYRVKILGADWPGSK